MGKNFRETLNEQMKDPEFRAEWEAQEPERQIMHAILEGRSWHRSRESIRPISVGWKMEPRIPRCGRSSVWQKGWAWS